MERASASGSSLPLCSITHAVRTCFSVVIDGFSILREAFTISFSPLLWLDLRQTLNSRRFIFRHTLFPTPHLWSKIRQWNNRSLGWLILVAVFPLCTLHPEPSASHCSCLRIGLSLPFLPLPTLHLEIKISPTQGPFCTICSVVTGSLVLCKMPGLNNGMRWFVSSSWSSKPWAKVSGISSGSSGGSSGVQFSLYLSRRQAPLTVMGGLLGSWSRELCCRKKLLS